MKNKEQRKVIIRPTIPTIGTPVMAFNLLPSIHGDERYEPKENTFICYEGNDIVGRVNAWLLENMLVHDSSMGEKLEVKIEIRIIE